MLRKAVHSGMFYPNSKDEIEEMIKKWNEIIDTHLKDKSILELSPKAIISPHAGYIYSGFTANFAYRVAKQKKRAIVIGPSHRIYLNHISASKYDTYETPLGNLEIDSEYLKILEDKFELIGFTPEAHAEHSTETQMPFLKHYLPDIKVIEFVYGGIEYGDLSKILDFILNDNDNLIIISTDLSHFYNLEEAKALDNICLNGVENLAIDRLNSGCEACGKVGVNAIVDVAKKRDLKPMLLDYRTSADASGDNSRVVGYMSSIFI